MALLIVLGAFDTSAEGHYLVIQFEISSERLTIVPIDNDTVPPVVEALYTTFAHLRDTNNPRLYFIDERQRWCRAIADRAAISFRYFYRAKYYCQKGAPFPTNIRNLRAALIRILLEITVEPQWESKLQLVTKIFNELENKRTTKTVQEHHWAKLLRSIFSQYQKSYRQIEEDFIQI